MTASRHVNRAAVELVNSVGGRTVPAYQVEFLFFALESVFAVWIVFLGGAEWLEDTAASALWIHPGALAWGATGIKLVVGLGWLGSVFLDLLQRL